jgi:hypothetical protein
MASTSSSARSATAWILSARLKRSETLRVPFLRGTALSLLTAVQSKHCRFSFFVVNFVGERWCEPGRIGGGSFLASPKKFGSLHVHYTVMDDRSPITKSETPEYVILEFDSPTDTFVLSFPRNLVIGLNL